MTKVYQIDQIYRVLGIAIKRVYGYCIQRPLQRYNVDNRAERVLESSEPRMAPRHEGTQEKIDRLISEYPDLRKSLETRSDELVDRLKSVKVISRDHVMNAEQKAIIEKLREEARYKPLPKARNSIDFPWHAYAVPEFVPKHKADIGMVAKFLEDHLNDPKEHNVEKIVKDFTLKEEDVINILEHFKPFRVVTAPEDRRDKGLFSYFTADRLKELMQANRINEFYTKKSEKLKERASKETTDTEVTEKK